MREEWKQTKIYAGLQWKRAGKIFPAVLITTLLLAGSVWLFVHMLLKLDASGEYKQKVQIGIVGETKDNYLGVGIYALQRLDESRFEIDFYEMTEAEAESALERGELTAYVRIPEDFLESVVTGENKPLTYVTTSRSGGINVILADELVRTVSRLVQESQNGIYSAQSYMVSHGMQDALAERTDELNLKYIDYVLHRSQLYDIKSLGIGEELSAAGYYLCGLTVFFLLLWGIHASFFLIRRRMELERLLAARGVGAAKQVMGEFSAYLLLMYGTLFLTAVLCMTGMRLGGFVLPEWENADGMQMFWFVLQLFPAAAMICAMQFLLCELVSGLISGILLEFVTAVGLGYLSGCLYPLHFFPEAVQRIAGFLPSGAAMRYLSACLTGQESGAGWLVAGYFVLFTVLSVRVRKKKLSGSGA